MYYLKSLLCSIVDVGAALDPVYTLSADVDHARENFRAQASMDRVVSWQTLAQLIVCW